MGDKPVTILDLGGTEGYWQRMGLVNSERVHITLLNIEKIETRCPGLTSLQADACDLSMFRDKEFDIVFSNSLIEHLYSAKNQKKMADEVLRVGRYYHIQTPNRYFPIEPHWLIPFFQFFPFTLKVWLTRHLNLGNHPRQPDRELAIRRVKEVRLLGEGDMQQLFPDGSVYRERFFGLVKSITMYRFPIQSAVTRNSPVELRSSERTVLPATSAFLKSGSREGHS